MTILFTTHQGELAGSTLSLIYLARGLADRGHQVHVACRRGVMLWQQLYDYPNILCHHIPFGSYLDFRSCALVKEIVVNHHVQLINAQGGRDRNLTIAAKWWYRLPCKLVFTRRQRPRNEPWIKRWFHTFATDKIIMISDGLNEIFVNKGYRKDHLQVIKNGVPSDLMAQVNPSKVKELRRLHDLEGKTVVGCLARKKSQEQLVRAFQYLPQNYVGLFVGIDQSEVPEADHIAQRLIFTGKLDHATTLHYLSLMTVNVLPSYLDGFGLVLVEAMLAGVPVIASNFGGIPDIIRNGENGFLFENGDEAQLADRILEICENPHLRAQFASIAMKDAKSLFSIDRVVTDYEAFFQSL